jgi:hypothetical protein
MMEPAKQGASYKTTRVMAEKRMQVWEDLRLDQFMPPLHFILVVCEKCGKCASLLARLPAPSTPVLSSNH